MTPSKEPYVCPASQARWLTTPLRRVFTDPRRVLRGLAGTGDTVADLGCGPGFFTLPLAEAVGASGSVIAVDLQAAMLDRLRERATKAGLASRIRPQQCGRDSLGLDGLGPFDFALAFWMIHEVPSRAALLAEVFGALRPRGRLLAVEPRGHVSPATWAATLDDAAAAGFTVAARPRIAFSRAALLERRTA